MNRIKELRIASNMSQAQLGSAIGCTGPTVSRFETEARQLDPLTICALCDLFNVTADYLLGRSDNPLPAISEDEARLLLAYRAANLRDRGLVDQILSAYMPAGEQAAAVS